MPVFITYSISNFWLIKPYVLFVVDAPLKKKNKHLSGSGHLWKVLVAFIVVLAVATTVIYVVGQNKTTLKEKGGEDKRKTTPVTKKVKNEKIKKDQKVQKEEVAKKKRPLITNKYDKVILDQLKDAEKVLKNRDIERAKKKFESLVKAHPNSPRSMYGLAKSLDDLADLRRSNEILKEAISTFSKVGKIKDCPRALHRMAVFRQAERLAFLGRSDSAAAALRDLAQSLPDDIEVLNKLGVQYLIKANNREAKEAFKKVRLSVFVYTI